MAEHQDFNDELMTERCQWAFAIDCCNIPDKQRRRLVEFLPMIAEISLLHGGDDAVERFLKKHIPRRR